MKVLQLVAFAAAYVFVIVEAAARFDPPFWLVAVIVIGPFMAWLYWPLFRRRPSDLRDRPDTGCAPTLLDLLLDR
jgi:hypothetical protein